MKKSSALHFLLLMSFVSLFADMTYEGARSITGPFMATLGANAAIVGFVTGFAEFLGYALRFFSGWITEYTEKYWTITFLGYVCNLLAVPLLALAGHWWIAAVLIILERSGRAIRIPPRDAMLSYTGQHLGMGWIFGLHEAIDQIGAMLGPIIVATVLYFHGGYPHSFAILLIPALCALSLLGFTCKQFPQPEKLSIHTDNLQTNKLPRSFWIYLFGSMLVAAGFADFPLIAYHFQKKSLLQPIWIPIFYACALGITSLTAPLFGWLYDKYGMWILIFATIIASLFAPFSFLGNFKIAFIGTLLWGIGVSAHESFMRAIVANQVSPKRRASAYGIFNMGFGLAWFLGSFAMGMLYDFSIMSLVIFSVASQLLAVPIFWIVRKQP
ncbi:MAG: MFS transporter [Gammaproteobacteria bacterium]|nr:MFS transporter [Gammaproteobacteria bacterium]